MSDSGKKLLKDLAKTVRDKTTAAGEPLLNQKGLQLMEELSRELTGPDAVPGLKLWRDHPGKFRLQRERKNAEISLEWQRNIGAVVITCTRLGKEERLVRYIWDEPAAKWRRLDGGGELWEDLTAALVDYLFPEGHEA